MHFLISKRLRKIIHSPRNLEENKLILVANTVPADGLAPLGTQWGPNLGPIYPRDRYLED